MTRSRLFLHSLLALSLVVAAAAAGGGCGSSAGDTMGNGNGTGDGGAGASSGSNGSSGQISGSSSSGQTSSSSGQTSSGSGGPNACVAPASVTVSPGALAQDVTPGTAFTQAFTATADGKDVTSLVQFTTSDANVGTFTGATFNWAGKFGGALTVSAMYCGVVGTTTLNLKIHAPAFTAGSGATSLPTTFSTAGTSSATACKPVLKYPPDQILLPPNTNVIEVHFLESGNTQFEISFTNAVTDVRVYTTCSAANLASGDPDVANGAPAPGVTGGCLFELNQQEWDFIANSNRNGLPLNVGVRGLGCDGGNAAASDTRQISFGEQDVIGTLYYWASIRLASTNENSGGVYRYDYGKRGQTAEAVLTPSKDANGNGANSNGLCVGCHFLDREGRKMVFDFDDNDNDDEYGDMWTSVWDIPSKTPTSTIQKNAPNAFSAGYSTWNRAASEFLKSDGWGTGVAGDSATAYNGPRGTFHVISNAGQPDGKTLPVLTSLRGTTPDIAPNDDKVIFAAAYDDGLTGNAHVEGGPTTPGFFGTSSHTQTAADGYTDQWFSGAGLYSAPWDSSTGQIGTPSPIFVAAASTATSPPNFYYPAFSPDGSLIAFNYAASGANFHNPKARFELVTNGGTTAADQHRANETNPVENNGDITNSWVRWTPFIQDYKGKKLAWVTFSSTRSYGLRINNNGSKDCYPTENPNTTVYPTFTGGGGGPPPPPPGQDAGAGSSSSCARAQLWMAAVDLDTGKVASGQDVSYPAFWLPFQDRTTQNHLGQWTQKNFSGTCGADAGGGNCPTGYVCDNGGCAEIPPSSTQAPPPAQCTEDVQCATGTCCDSGTCGACADTGAPPPTCNTCLDCGGQACTSAGCGACTTSADCCAPLTCQNGSCTISVK